MLSGGFWNLPVLRMKPSSVPGVECHSRRCPGDDRDDRPGIEPGSPVCREYAQLFEISNHVTFIKSMKLGPER